MFPWMDSRRPPGKLFSFPRRRDHKSDSKLHRIEKQSLLLLWQTLSSVEVFAVWQLIANLCLRPKSCNTLWSGGFIANIIIYFYAECCHLFVSPWI